MVLNETYHFPDYPLWPHLPMLTAFKLCPWSTYLLYHIKLGIFSLPQKVVLLAMLPFSFYFLCMFSTSFMTNYLAHIASRVHITKIIKQVWNKANFEAWSEARYQNFDTLVSLLASYFTLPSLTSRMLTLYLHLLLRLPLRLLHKCEPGLKAHTYLNKPTAKSCRFI